MNNGAAPIRVIFLAPKLGLGGMTHYLVELAAAMCGLGHAIRVVTVDGPGIARFRGELERTGAPVDVVPSLTRAAMRSAILAHKADCVKLFTGAFPPDTRLSARLLGTGIPIVESIHVVPNRPEVRLTQQAFYRARNTSRYAMVVFTEEVEAEVRTRIPSLAPCVHRLRYGMRIPEHGLHTHTGGIRFITVCRLDEAQKDVETLLRGFAMVLEGTNSEPRPSLTVVGDGKDREHLVRLAGALMLGDRVTFTGWVDDPITRLREADIFVLSTRRESPGRVNIEASAVGLPVIASRVEGCTESVADGVSGMLVTPGDAGAMAVAMARLARDPEVRARLGEGGRAHSARFDIGVHAAGVCELLDGVRSRA